MSAGCTIHDISDFAENPVKISTALFLLTIERSDESPGGLSKGGNPPLAEPDSEPGGVSQSDLVILQSIVESSEPESYTAAARTLQAHWQNGPWRRVLVPFILTAVANGRLSASGNHILRFISRLAFGSEAPLL
jgi:hypothetical protein